MCVCVSVCISEIDDVKVLQNARLTGNQNNG